MKEEYLDKTAKQDACVNTCCERQSARGVLENQHFREQKRAHAISTLLKVIPWNILSREDEATLYDFFSEQGRR